MSSNESNQLSPRTPTQSPLTVVRGLGQGGFAVVVKVKHRDSGSHYAMKVIAKDKAPGSKEREALKTELRIMTELFPCPFLQKCHMSFESRSDVFFVLDLIEGGDLFSHLVNRMHCQQKGFSESQVSIILAEVILGLEHLHEQGYIHRDIKVHNHLNFHTFS